MLVSFSDLVIYLSDVFYSSFYLYPVYFISFILSYSFSYFLFFFLIFFFFFFFFFSSRRRHTRSKRDWSSDVCSSDPTSRLILRASATQSAPATLAEPLVGRANPTRILIAVVLPAPLGPTKPRI